MKKNIKAFSMIEALITVAIIGILLALGLPGLQDFIRNSEMTSKNNDLVTALQYARSESIKRGDRVVLCASRNSMDPLPACATQADWLQGWIVFHDGNNDAVFTPGPDTLLKQYPTMAATGLTITPEVLKVGDPQTIREYVSFARPRGEPQEVNTTNQSGVFRICSDDGGASSIRGVMLQVSGRIFSSSDSATLGAHITCP